MSGQRPTIDVKCHHCKVGPGEWCVDHKGERAVGFHKAREWFAKTGEVHGAVNISRRIKKKSKRSIES